MENLLFYLMAALAVGSALGVVLARNPIASVLSLLASFFALATIYLLAGFQFLAAAQILVYAGAIMVLFLFVIMLLNLADSPLQAIDKKLFARRHIGVIVAVTAALLVVGIAAASSAHKSEFALVATPLHGLDDAHELATAMFGRFLLPFEATSLLLLATAVAVIVLAKRDRGAKTETRGETAIASGDDRGSPASNVRPAKIAKEDTPKPAGAAR